MKGVYDVDLYFMNVFTGERYRVSDCLLLECMYKYIFIS